MAYFSPEQWVALFAVGAIGILAILHILAGRVCQELALHDLRVKAMELRRGYSARIAAMRALEEGGVVEAEIVGEIAPAAAAELLKAA